MAESTIYTGIYVFASLAVVLALLLIVACFHRYYKLKTMRATAAMLPDWDGRQQLNDTPPVGPAYLPAPPSTANFRPLPNVLYTGTPYHHPLPAHVQFYQQQHLQAVPQRLPTTTDRNDFCATPGAYQLNQQAALATPNVVGCFYGATFVPTNPYGPTNYGLCDEAEQQRQIEAAIIHQQQANQQDQFNQSPPSYDQTMYVKEGLTAVSD